MLKDDEVKAVFHWKRQSSLPSLGEVTGHITFVLNYGDIENKVRDLKEKAEKENYGRILTKVEVYKHIETISID